MKKKLIITAGGTSEKIDAVRSITNKATGQLGKLIAKKASSEFDIYFVASETVKTDDLPSSVHLVEVNDVMKLMETMEKLLTENDIFAVIHTMAVSDFYLEGIATEEQVQHVLTEEDELRHFQWTQLFMPTKEGKLSSQQEALYLKLVPAPKVIQYIKEWSENTILIGFKLLVNATEEEEKMAAKKQQLLAHSDFVLVNDLTHITDHQHPATLIQGEDVIGRFKTKEEIANALMILLMERK